MHCVAPLGDMDSARADAARRVDDRFVKALRWRCSSCFHEQEFHLFDRHGRLTLRPSWPTDTNRSRSPPLGPLRPSGIIAGVAPSHPPSLPRLSPLLPLEQVEQSEESKASPASLPQTILDEVPDTVLESSSMGAAIAPASHKPGVEARAGGDTGVVDLWEHSSPVAENYGEAPLDRPQSAGVGTADE